MKLKYISMLVLGASLGLTSCNDFLDKEPESNVTPAAFFTAESDLAAYTINLYGVLTSIAPGSYRLFKPLGARQLESRPEWWCLGFRKHT